MSKVSAITNFRNNGFRAMEHGIINSNKTNAPYEFDAETVANDKLKNDELLENTLSNNLTVGAHRCANAISIYPAKGFAGSKNSNFYEYLTMGMFPYVMGSLTFIALFNGATKYFSPRCEKAAKKYGFGMALGVIFYAAAKELAKKFISVPVKLKTGIDMDRPYKKVVNLVQRPEDVVENSAKASGLEKDKSTDIEYHRTFESVDFPRTDLLYDSDPQKRNKIYDEIARKNGFGTNLTDSDQEVIPFMKEVVVKTKTAQTLSQYLWAATGVGLGVQKPWIELLNIKSFKTSGLSIGSYLKKYGREIKTAFVDSCKSFYNGGLNGSINKTAKYTGRTILGLAIASTVLGVINAVRNPYVNNDKKMNETKIFDETSKVEED